MREAAQASCPSRGHPPKPAHGRSLQPRTCFPPSAVFRWLGKAGADQRTCYVFVSVLSGTQDAASLRWAGEVVAAEPEVLPPLVLSGVAPTLALCGSTRRRCSAVQFEAINRTTMTSIVTARINYWDKIPEGYVVFNIEVSCCRKNRHTLRKSVRPISHKLGISFVVVHNTGGGTERHGFTCRFCRACAIRVW